MKKLIKNKEVLLIVAILLLQVVAECAHLPFEGDVRRSIFWTNYRLLHIGLVPSILMYYFFKTRDGKFLSCILAVYNGLALLMELYAIFIDKELIIKLNKYWYAEFILIFISLTLMYLVRFMNNGFGLPRIVYNWFLHLSSLLQRRNKS